jgi:hypothetical protein
VAATGCLGFERHGRDPSVREGAVVLHRPAPNANRPIRATRWLEVGKRATEQRYRVKSYVVERPIEKTVTVRDERVEIEHRPISRTGDLSMPQEREIEVVERHEEPFAEKRVTGAEEVVVRKEVVERPETVRGTVRETKVEIDDGRGTATTPTNPSTTPPRR